VSECVLSGYHENCIATYSEICAEAEEEIEYWQIVSEVKCSKTKQISDSGKQRLFLKMIYSKSILTAFHAVSYSKCVYVGIYVFMYGTCMYIKGYVTFCKCA
jgi:hypothetical protein